MEEMRGFLGCSERGVGRGGGEPASPESRRAFQGTAQLPSLLRTPIALAAVSTNCYISIMGYDVLDLRLEFEKAEDHLQQSGNGNLIGSSFRFPHVVPSLSFPLNSFASGCFGNRPLASWTT